MNGVYKTENIDKQKPNQQASYLSSSGICRNVDGYVQSLVQHVRQKSISFVVNCQIKCHRTKMSRRPQVVKSLWLRYMLVCPLCDLDRSPACHTDRQADIQTNRLQTQYI